ncbi:plastocyanin/azurin family copper-binding protein [Oligoflexus tunisiensis]|uniref:plastocyanin/azurin family copper-binding protein n=1 Tax=Oligoflexus tunisiensis TaxID=708132 RepID=UPI00114D126C|nr:plastocyanin/azurin family copper-binding protein [Oligoflexus tunisiensis]
MSHGISATLALFLVCPTLWAKDHVITQKGRQFSRSKIVIHPGDTIVFKNDDDTPHNVFTTSEVMKFNLGVQKAGTELRHVFSKAGEGEIRCAIHPKMKLNVRVSK